MRRLIDFVKSSWPHLMLIAAANILLYYLFQNIKGGTLVILFTNLVFLRRDFGPAVRIVFAVLMALVCFHAIFISYTRHWYDWQEAILQAFSVLMLIVFYLAPILNLLWDENAKH